MVTGVRQDMVTGVRQDMVTGVRQTAYRNTADRNTTTTRTTSVVVGFSAAGDKESEGGEGEGKEEEEETRTNLEWLKAYGITGPVLEELAEKPYALVRGWMVYLDRQGNLTEEGKRGILVARLREGRVPPLWAERYGQSLPVLMPWEEAALRQAREKRETEGKWPAEALEILGENNDDGELSERVAEWWLEVEREVEQKSGEKKRKGEKPIDFEKYTRGPYADLFGNGAGE